MARELPNPDRMRLFDAVLAGDADASQVRELEQLLDSDRTARDQFALLSQLDVNLRYAFRTGALDEAAPATEQTPAPHFSRASERKRPGKQFWLWSLALAATIVVIVGNVDFTPDVDDSAPGAAAMPTLASKPPAPVATLTSLNHAIWDGQDLKVGHAIREGDTIHLASGEAHISAGFGAEIVVTGPCALKFVEFERVKLEYGDVVVHVAEWAKGFTIVTDAMDVVDLGTTFTVSADRHAGVQTSVIKGLVRVHPKVADSTGRRGVLVSEGGSYGVDNQGRGDALSKVPKRLLADLDLGSLVPYRPIDLMNTGVNLLEGDEDPHWRVVAGPAESFPGPRFVVVCQPDERYLANNAESSQWVSAPNWRTAQRNSVYTFQTEFRLDGYDLSTIQIFGRFLADNGVQEVRVNGKPVKVESWIDNVSFQEFDHSQFRFVNVTEGLLPGDNFVEIDVWNGVFREPAEWGDRPNPMALRVEWLAFGRHEK